MGKVRTGISMPEQLYDELDDFRETDTQHPEFRNRSEMAVDAMAVGMAVFRMLDAFDWPTEEVAARQTVKRALDDLYEAEEGEDPPYVSVGHRPYRD